MRSLEDIKKYYFFPGDEISITQDEKEYYHITDEVLLEWRTEDQLKTQKDFIEHVSLVDKNKVIWHDNYNNPIKSNLESINLSFSLAITFTDAKDEVYDNIEELFDIGLKYEIFDYYTFCRDATYTDIRIMRNHLYAGKDHRCKWIDDKPIVVEEWYIGLLPKLYLANKINIFERVLNIFINKMYPKYGLFMQEAMKTLVQFCKEYNLPYLDKLLECHKKAREEDYPSHHEYKFKCAKRDDVKWEEINI